MMKPEITKQTQYLPLFFATQNASILLVGGGNIASAKLNLLLEFTDNITVLAKNINKEIREIARVKSLKLIITEFEEFYIRDHDLVIAATDDFKVNQSIAEYAKSKNILVNIVDNPKYSNCIFGSIVKRGDITIAISSNGVSPVLTRFIKQKIEKLLPVNFAKLTEFISAYRQNVKTKLNKLQPRRLFWQKFFESNILEEIYQGNEDKAAKLFNSSLNKFENQNQTALYLIGVGPGDPDLLTVKAARLIAQADIILYDRLVADDIISIARKEAVKINVGKTKDFHRYTQIEINQLIKKYLKEGKIVARLKGGDTAIFANLSDEIDVAKSLDVNYQIVPGVTSANGAAAYLGIALTKRDQVRGVRYLTYYRKDLLDKEYWQELAKTKDSLIFYMSSHHINEIIYHLVKFGKDKSTPIAAIEQATSPYQKHYLANLEDFSLLYQQKKFKSPTIIVIGEILKDVSNYQWIEESKEYRNFFNPLELRDAG